VIFRKEAANQASTPQKNLLHHDQEAATRYTSIKDKTRAGLFIFGIVSFIQRCIVISLGELSLSIRPNIAIKCANLSVPKMPSLGYHKIYLHILFIYSDAQIRCGRPFCPIPLTN
jgi:hypothetical protein